MKKLIHLSGVVLPVAAATLGLNPETAKADIIADLNSAILVDTGNGTYDPVTEGGIYVGDAGATVRAFLDFDLSSIPGTAWDKATLVLTDQFPNQNAGPWELYRVDDSWSLGSPPTYNQDVGGNEEGDPMPLGTPFNANLGAGIYSFDVSEVVRNWMTSSYTNGNNGFSLQFATNGHQDPDSPSGQIVFVADGPNAPFLQISVPEPVGMGLMVMSGLLLTARRRPAKSKE